MMEKMSMGIMTPRALSISKAKIVLSSAFVVFIVAAVAIFMGFQSEIGTYSDSDTEFQFEPQAEVPAAYPNNSFDRNVGLETDDAMSVSDFGSRLDAVDGRLIAMEQSVLQIKYELSNYKGTESEISQSLSSELHTLKSRIAQLTNADSTLSQSLEQIKIALQRMQTEEHQDSQSELPVVGLKLLNVSIWDDGAVAIVSLGNRKTALSVGNFFAGLKVEDISVTEQSLTLYEPATNKLYTLYADAIVYKEVHAQ